MTERRQYTGTQRLQIAWSLGIVAVALVVAAIDLTTGLPVSSLVPVLIISVLWLVGLASLGFRDRRQWNRMVEESAFDRQAGTNTADLERIVEGRSVTISTSLPGPLSQTHTELTTSVAGVDASFSVEVRQRADEGVAGGVTTGHEQFDERFVVEGKEQNVTRILTPEVRTALLDVRTPGVCTVTGDAVSYEVPFTNLSPEELDTIAEALVVVATRVEDVGSN